MDVERQMIELQCNTLRRTVMMIRVILRRGILMLMLMAMLFFSDWSATCSARLLLLSELAIRSRWMVGLLRVRREEDESREH